MRCLSFVVFIGLVLGTQARATVIQPASFEAYSRLATVVVHGWVVDQTFVRPDDGLPYTRVLLQPIDAAGELPGGPIEVRVPGGRDALGATHVAGAPRFELFEEVVLFLWRQPLDGSLLVLGLSNGACRVARTRAQPDGALRGHHAQEAETPAALLLRVAEARAAKPEPAVQPATEGK